MRTRWLVVLALLAFAAALVLRAPAALLYAWAFGADAPAPARLHGVHGTLVEGGFASLTVNDRPVLGEGRWRLQPAWLALLRLSADVEAAGDSVLRVRVSRGVLGALRLSGLTAAGSARALLGALGQPPLPVEGQVRLDVPLLRVDDGVPIEAEGSVDLQNLVWTLAREPLALGSFTAALTTDDKGILATLDSVPGPLEVTGTATLAPTRAYELHLQIRPRSDATPAMQALVRSLGAPDAQGWYHLRRSGTLG